MSDNDFQKLVEDMEAEFLKNPGIVFGIVGLTSVTLRLLDILACNGLLKVVTGIYGAPPHSRNPPTLPSPVKDVSELAKNTPDILIIAADSEKENLIATALPFIKGAPKLLVSGYAHLEYADRALNEELSQLLAPSFANGYRYTLIHIHQCLKNAAQRRLKGIVVEFGMFRGGTTMLMARLIKRIGAQWKIIGFDSFSGFPPRRSPLDMYDHPGCVFTDLAAVKRYFEGENVEIVPGDIVQTAMRLATEQIVLAFMDTDNFSPATAALDVIQERIVVGGAIIFDHFTGEQKFRYTLGERLAGKRLLDDPRFFHLHGTGVFFRQQ